ncbi:MAG: aminotransferase class V-fold PLP-dependent enzyme [Cyclobacteriaceae bacterium]
MISFYPGPSKVYPEVTQYVADAYQSGVVSINHRSPEFMDIFRKTTESAKEKLAVPESYTVLFASSATECWEIISQSLVRDSSFHVYNGAFGEKWHRYATQLSTSTNALVFDPEELPETRELESANTAELLCLTHNETSNGTALPTEWMHEVRSLFPDLLISVDATSSMAGVILPWDSADIWYASVQKCFGLPAGLAVLILSPAAVDRAREIGEKKHYNSLVSIIEQSDKFQTTHTPNVLGIYLLMRTLEAREEIRKIDQTTRERYREWIGVIDEIAYAKLLIDNTSIRSNTVIPIKAYPSVINQLRMEAKQSGITLGNGYGALKETTLRIANFPAITEHEIQTLLDFLEDFSPST